MHLQAATALFPTLQHGCETTGTQNLPHAYRSALYFFVGIIIWYETLSCATTGLKPLVETSCRDSNAPPPVQLEKIMGCENWAVFQIMDIANLSHWKTVEEANGTLSMRELVRRGAEIEQILEEGLAKNSLDSTAFEQLSPSSRCKPNQNIPEVTRIFASAALVYLHVIVSGPYPEIPEVRQSVLRTAAAIESLSNKDLIGNLTWPVCVAGCMAARDQESFFRNVISDAGADVSPFGNPSKALMVMEECWRMRRGLTGRLEGVEWLKATKSLGFDVLLV